ncbi:MAG: hypothetical protein EXS13_13690 [Planctomycetes bacterium]|nr:hypothetical protein [Planctomycetota bacterium]
MRAQLLPLAVLTVSLTASLTATARDARYSTDFDFLVDTVKRDYAGFACKKDLDWDATCKRFAPRFRECANDRDHVRNVMALPATLRDSHTGVLETKVDWKELPSKFDGLYGAGLCVGFDAGKWVVRGAMPGHPLADSLPAGALLLDVGGLPAWFAMGREERRVARFQGLSSDRSFWASLCNKAFPFGEARTLAARFLLPDGKPRKVELPRFGPDGKSFDFVGLYLPDGVVHADGAVAAKLALPWSKQVGFLKVTGGQDATTVKAFHAAFDTLKGIDALLLDCRGMGGGGDDCAWEMCGRLFPKGADNGRHGKLAASGSWQFDGPVVMLQDEMEVSSAETFAWTLCETKRVVCVGRDTGGWGIIPKRFAPPSGLAEFRLGVNWRATPITQFRTEEVGWPCDVKVPLGPRICAWSGEERYATSDPTMELGTIVLRTLHGGVPTDEARAGFAALGEGNLAAWSAFEKKAAARDKELAGEKLGKRFADDLEAEIEQELAALRDDELPPDWIGVTRRLPRLVARAKSIGSGAKVAPLEKLVKGAKNEIAAQQALLELLGDPDPKAFDDPARRKAWLAKQGATKSGAWVKGALWK